MSSPNVKEARLRNVAANVTIVVLLAGMLVATLAGRTASYRRLCESLKELRAELGSLGERVQALEVDLAGLSALRDDLGRAIEALDHWLSMTVSKARRPALGHEDRSPTQKVKTAEEISAAYPAAEMRLWSLEELLLAFGVEGDVPGPQRDELRSLIRRFQALFDILRGRRGGRVDALVRARNSSGDYRVVSESQVRSGEDMLDHTQIRGVKSVGGEIPIFDFDRETYPELFVEFESGVEALKEKLVSEVYLILSEPPGP